MLLHTADIRVTHDYYEADEKAEIRFDYGGDNYAPFNPDEEDIVSMPLARSMAENPVHTYEDGRNKPVASLRQRPKV